MSLRTPCRFVSLARRDRRALLAALNKIGTTPDKLGDVLAYAEAFKRLGERLHPHEHADTYPFADLVFAVARGEAPARSLSSRVEAAFKQGNTTAAVHLLGTAPGMLLRQVDRIAAALRDHGDDGMLYTHVNRAAERASGRVLLSLREHLWNRFEDAEPGAKRIFTNRSGRAYVTPDTRPALPQDLAVDLCEILDREIALRLPKPRHLVVDPAVERAAIPLSGKATAAGLNVLPRGSRTTVAPGTVRLFVHWMQTRYKTDYDLSMLLLDKDFRHYDQVSYTNLHTTGAVHSGDITSAPAPAGASEFVDIDLARIGAAFIVPQVNVFAGESFDDAAEAFVGYMHLQPGQKGKPFEARTVRMKTDLHGTNGIALPMALQRRDDGSWDAVWMNLYGRGMAAGNRVEANRLSTALLARGITGRSYLTLGYIARLLKANAEAYTEWREGLEFDEPVTFIGIERPENLPEGSDVYDLDRWNQLVPV